MFVDKLHRDSKAVNPGAPGLYLGPAYDNNMELNHFLVQRYDTGKRVRAQYVFANEDRMPLKRWSIARYGHASLDIGIKERPATSWDSSKIRASDGTSPGGVQVGHGHSAGPE